MSLEPVLICAQCGVRIVGEPIGLGAELFCCLGCVGGGPCICDHAEGTPLLLRVGPFASQAALMAFAHALERAPGLFHVELTHADPREARFTITAPSVEVLALAVEAHHDHTIRVETSGTTVTGRVIPPAPRDRKSTRLNSSH